MSLHLLPHQDFARNPQRALPYLAEYLKDGSLALVLGAGVSQPLGLPAWWELVDRCARAIGLKEQIDAHTPPTTLMRVIEQVEYKLGQQSDQYRKQVRTCLYDGVAFTQHSVKELLLIALGALLMGSKRGSIREVMTFNFDDALEWYLRLHGFCVQVVTKLPELRTDADVTIYHPNGFLPHDTNTHSMSDFLIFSEYSFHQRMGDRVNDWQQAFRDLITSRVGLFVGLSPEQPPIELILADISERIRPHRYSGVWLFGPHLGRPLPDQEVERLFHKNILALCFASQDDIPPFLLELCQQAAIGL